MKFQQGMILTLLLALAIGVAAGGMYLPRSPTISGAA